MRHKLDSLDHKQVEDLLKNDTLENIANYYSASTTTISELFTKVYKDRKLNRPVEKIGSWMESEERKALKTAIKKDEWLLLKETNLYKKLMYGNKNTL